MIINTRPDTPPHPHTMRIHEEAALTASEYRDARTHLGLSREQLAYEVGASVSTIKKRELGENPIHREAQLAMRWLQTNPPTTPAAHIIKTLTPCNESHGEGDRFGLFTVLDVRKSHGPGFTRCPTSFVVKCNCGTVKTVMAASFHHRYICEPKCPAYAAMRARGSYVDAHGDILDQDGLPES